MAEYKMAVANLKDKMTERRKPIFSYTLKENLTLERLLISRAITELIKKRYI